GLNHNTVCVANERLATDGWLMPAGGGQWQLRPVSSQDALGTAGDAEAAQRRLDSLTCLEACPVSATLARSAVLRVNHDAFSRGALGKNGHRMLEALARNGGRTAAQLARELGVHRSTASRCLAKCEE